MRLSAGELARVTGGDVVGGDPEVAFDGFAHDSRALEPGACFVALVEHRDGHDFVADAFARGAAVALVARAVGDRPGPGRAIVRVGDPRAALGAAAAAIRRRLATLEVVGITGSSGKTSTKDLVAGALARSRVVRANAESFNNEVGLPITVAGADERTDVLVAEMGARFPGNIAALCEIAAPTVGVVTNIGLAHVEHLGGPEGVARVKGELLEALPPSGLAIVPADDRWVGALSARTAARILAVGRDRRADVALTGVTLDDALVPRIDLVTPWGDLTARVGLRGEHQAVNAAMAAGVALALGVDRSEVASGLADAQGSPWRMHLDRSPAGLTVLNDAYNANPDSMAAALRALGHLPVRGRRIAVLGPMRELGPHATEAHEALGEQLSAARVDHVVVVGRDGDATTLARAAAVVSDVVVVDDAAEALGALVGVVGPEDAVLVKASRSVGLESVATGLVGGAADRHRGRERPAGTSEGRR